MNRIIVLCILVGRLWTAVAIEPAAPTANPSKGGSSAISTPIANITPIPKQSESRAGWDDETVDSPTSERESHTLNKYVLRAIVAVPSGGGYAVTKTAMANLSKSMRIEDNGSLGVTPSVARPSFCSSATYLIFLHAIEEIEASGTIKLSAAIKKKLFVKNQSDGVGVWGRWNANGPGTARLFYELKLGRNFTELSEAQPGDFLKIWWTDAVGAKEKGHSVIFLGKSRDEQGNPSVIYWSSNLPTGFGEKVTPMSRIKHMVFSRLQHPERLNYADRMPEKDAYLSSMLTSNEPFTNLLVKIGVVAADSPADLSPEEVEARQ
jgi:hypothetical protein